MLMILNEPVTAWFKTSLHLFNSLCNLVIDILAPNANIIIKML